MATNVCDQFCYLVLTMPEKPGEISQVIVRSVVHPCYKAEKAPLVYTRAESDRLEIFKSDGKTLLDGNDSELDFVNENPFEKFTQDVNNSDTSVQDDELLDDAFEDNIFEVLGPPTKKTKILLPNDLKESGAENPLTSSTPDNNDTTDNKTTTTPAAATPPSDIPTMNVNIISQDDNDLDSARDSSIDIQELVARQLERASEEHQNDEDFTSISSHKWSDNGLLLGIKYSTGEVTFSPFSYVKLDYPDEAACYILKNDVGYTHNKKKPGKYIAWARSFKREIRSAVCWLF